MPKSISQSEERKLVLKMVIDLICAYDYEHGPDPAQYYLESNWIVPFELKWYRSQLAGQLPKALDEMWKREDKTA